MKFIKGLFVAVLLITTTSTFGLKPRRGTIHVSPNQTALINAASNQDWKTVEHLIKTKRVNVNKPGKWGMTVLMYAAGSAPLETVQWLVQHGATVTNAKSTLDWTSVMYALNAGHNRLNKGKTNKEQAFKVATYLISQEPTVKHQTTSSSSPGEILHGLGSGKTLDSSIEEAKEEEMAIEEFAKKLDAPTKLVKLLKTR